MKPENLILGNTYYCCFSNGPLIPLVYESVRFLEHMQRNEYSFKRDIGYYRTLNLEEIFETKDEAMYHWYSETTQQMREKINKKKEEIKKLQQNISSLDETKKYLQDKFPERFI